MFTAMWIGSLLPIPFFMLIHTRISPQLLLWLTFTTSAMLGEQAVGWYRRRPR